jgi:hypothetical protein
MKEKDIEMPERGTLNVGMEYTRRGNIIWDREKSEI